MDNTINFKDIYKMLIFQRNIFSIKKKQCRYIYKKIINIIKQLKSIGIAYIY